MTDGNGSTKTQLSVLAEINARLAAITPEQIVTPGLTRRDDMILVCIASDELRRLVTLHSLLADECNALAETGRGLLPEGVRVNSDIPSDIRPALDTIVNNLQPLNILFKLVEDIIKLEMHRLLPDWAAAKEMSIGIYSDWSICCGEVRKADIMEQLTGALLSVIAGCGDEHCSKCAGRSVQ